jgi:CMP-N-acetylneuraminic acid synthetase
MIALILARGGSKGVPRKNIKMMNSKPLLFYPIDAAKKSELIEEVYVSTDDEEIAEVARFYGAKVVMRPTELAQDDSTDLEAFEHFTVASGHGGPIVHLRATTPILDPKVIDEAIRVFRENDTWITSLRSIHEMSESAYKCFIKDDINIIDPISDAISADGPRQSYPKTYVANGYVDIVRPGEWQESGKLHDGAVYGFITDFAPEIDTMDDFEYVEYLMKKRDA